MVIAHLMGDILIFEKRSTLEALENKAVAHTPQKNPEIFAKMAAVMQEIRAVEKNDRNEHQHFNFRSVDAVYNELHPLLKKHGIFTVPEVLNRQYSDQPTKSGGSQVERILTVRYRFFTTDGSYVDAIVDGEALDSSDKATSKALAMAHKYALLQVFCIPTKEPDNDANSPERAGTPPPTVYTPEQEQQVTNSEFKETSIPASIKSPKVRIPTAKKEMDALYSGGRCLICKKEVAKNARIYSMRGVGIEHKACADR